jgi:hypothetical protein
MKHPIRKTTAFVSIAVMLFGLAAPARAGDPADDLKQIEYQYYFRGKYPQAIEALQTFLARVDVSGPVAVRASEFLAASHVLAGAPQAGKDVFARLIAADPAYAGPDATVFKPEVVDVYAQARSDYASLALKNPAVASADSTGAPVSTVPQTAVAPASKPIYKKWWFYAGAATIVGVVAGVAGSGGGGNEPPASRGSISVGVNVK